MGATRVLAFFLQSNVERGDVWQVKHIFSASCSFSAYSHSKCEDNICLGMVVG